MLYTESCDSAKEIHDTCKQRLPHASSLLDQKPNVSYIRMCIQVPMYRFQKNSIQKLVLIHLHVYLSLGASMFILNWLLGISNKSSFVHKSWFVCFFSPFNYPGRKSSFLNCNWSTNCGLWFKQYNKLIHANTDKQTSYKLCLEMRV